MSRRVFAAAVSLLFAGAACASRRGETLRADECAFVVYNRTPHALEIRIGNERTSVPVGTINQGESLSETAPCAQRWVWLYGIPVPERVGARVRFPYVVTGLELQSGARQSVELTWP